jgi:hypothetical protein
MTVDQAHAAAEEIARLVTASYVFSEKRATIAAAVRGAAAANRYDTANSDEFAERVTDDLRAAGHDRHLWVQYDPDTYRDLMQRTPHSDTSPHAREEGRRRNQGFEELRILSGNIRYVRITHFLWSNDTTGRIIDEAARFMSDGDAVVIDLRGNGGGNGSAVDRLISYFFDADDRVLMSYHDGPSGETIVNRVSNDLCGPRMPGKPLYVLIDDGTGSAAEGFAYQVQQFKLGTLVGQKTAGAANNNELFPVPPGFVASVSTGRPVHPVSQTNWEGVGVVPDVSAPTAAALDQAELAALQRLAQYAGETERPRYEWPLAAIEARLHPVKVSERDLRAYVGKYGVRTIRLEKDTLSYQREGRDPTTLIPMAPDLFAFANTADVRVRFRRSEGKVVGFDQITSDGQALPSDRSE